LAIIVHFSPLVQSPRFVSFSKTTLLVPFPLISPTGRHRISNCAIAQGLFSPSRAPFDNLFASSRGRGTSFRVNTLPPSQDPIRSYLAFCFSRKFFALSSASYQTLLLTLPPLLSWGLLELPRNVPFVSPMAQRTPPFNTLVPQFPACKALSSIFPPSPPFLSTSR